MSSVLRTSSERPILTSRDVYYFVAKSEQDCREAKELEQNTSRCYDNEHIDNKSVHFEYSNFNDERDCELQSVMTFHSDVVDDPRLQSAVAPDENRTYEDLLLRDQENTAINNIKETEIERQINDEETLCSPAKVEGQWDINPNITDKYRVVRDYLPQDSLSKETTQDYDLQDEGVCQIEEENAVFAASKHEDKRISNDSVQRKTRSKSSRKANGLPPRKTLVLLTTKGDPKKREKQKEMETAVKEILTRGENKIKELRVLVKNLRLDSEELRDENRALKKLQRIQGREVANMERFVHMTTTTARDIRKDVRYAEVSSFGIDTSLRRKNEEIRKLRRECERYEKLIDMDQKMPGLAELEERLDLAEKHLQDKDKQIQTLDKKVQNQENKRNKLRRKEVKRFAHLEEEVRGTLDECEELKQRLKVAERKINKTNIYSRRSTAMHNALPAPATLPALPWYPPVSRQTTSTKVKKWLNDFNNR